MHVLVVSMILVIGVQALNVVEVELDVVGFVAKAVVETIELLDTGVNVDDDKVVALKNR